MIYIYPYKTYSESANALRKGLSSHLGTKIKLVHPNGKFNPRRTDKVINWGNSTVPKWKWDASDINSYQAIKLASNKLTTLNILAFSGVNIPEYTENIDEARNWFTKKNTTVLCRRTLNGHSGRGIVVVHSPDNLVTAPLYVKYKKKRHEYRVHVIFGNVIDTQIKRKRQGTTTDNIIRNHSTGWVYCRENITVDESRDNEAIKAVKALNLDFGAVDIIYNELENKYYVLEVNTAPGLDGTTINKYVRSFANEI